MSLAFVVLAHADPLQVRRLIAALHPAPVFLHCDARTAPDVFADITGDLPPRVHLVPRRATHLASWSLVAAELDALRVALASSDAEHVVVMSGADYPLASMSQLEAELAPWRGHSWVASARLPWPGWDTRVHRDGGLWRLRHRFVTRADDSVVYWAGAPLRMPWRRRLPGDVELRASSQWKVFARQDVELLLDVVDTRPDLVELWRTSLVPDETFAASVLSSPRLVGDRALPLRRAHPWFIDWPEETTDHPRWLEATHFDRLRAARAAPVLLPQHDGGPDRPYRKLFARKVGSARSGALLERIDTELRQG